MLIRIKQPTYDPDCGLFPDELRRSRPAIDRTNHQENQKLIQIKNQTDNEQHIWK